MGLPGYHVKKPEEYGFQDIIYEKKDWVARIIINRPYAYNAPPSFSKINY